MTEYEGCVIGRRGGTVTPHISGPRPAPPAASAPNADHTEPRGVKHDEGKLRYDLIPPEVLESLARVLTHGAARYGKRNCERGFRQGRLFAALQRHTWAWWGGQDVDQDSGFSHLDHALWNAAMMVVQERRGVGIDDRHPNIQERSHP